MKIFFDFDGTLVDVSNRHYHVYEELVKTFGGKALSRDEYWQLKRNKKSWNEILTESQVPSDQLSKFMDKFINNIEEPSQLAKDRLIPGALDTLISLDDYELFLVSLRRNTDRLINQVDKLGIGDYFIEVIAGHSDKENDLPKVQIIKPIASDDYGMLVGDTETDILSAKKLGLVSVAVTSGLRNEGILKKHQPDFLITNVTELPNVVTRLSSEKRQRFQRQ